MISIFDNCKKIIEKATSDNKIRYLIVGGSSFVLEYSIFWLLVSLFRVDSILANIVSFVLAVCYTFYFHSRWTFRGEHKYDTKKQFMAYVTLATLNLLLTSILIAVQVDLLDVTPLIAKIVCMVMVVVWNYLFLSKLIFKKQ
jgi:putative flippase GtrA